MVIHKDIVEALTALEPGLHMMSLPRRLKVQAISSRAVSTKQPQEFSARTLEMSVSCRHGVSGARNARLQADTRTLKPCSSHPQASNHHGQGFKIP